MNEIALSFKSPDGVHDSVKEYMLGKIEKSGKVKEVSDPWDKSEQELADLFEEVTGDTRDSVVEKISKYVEYLEYVRIRSIWMTGRLL